MKQLKFFVLCSVVIALLAAPFAVLASSAAPSPLFGTSFDSSFIGDHAGWDALDSPWQLEDEEYYAATGIVGERSRIRHFGRYKDMVYQARLFRAGCVYCANSLTIRASGDNGKGDWTTGYHFQYTRRGYVSVWKVVDGRYTALMPWTIRRAVKKGSRINTLKVVAYGETFQFYINDILVWIGRDSSISAGGQVGITFYKRTSVYPNDKFYVDWVRLSLESELIGTGASTKSELHAEAEAASPALGDVNLAPMPAVIPESDSLDELSESAP